MPCRALVTQSLPCLYTRVACLLVCHCTCPMGPVTAPDQGHSCTASHLAMPLTPDLLGIHPALLLCTPPKCQLCALHVCLVPTWCHHLHASPHANRTMAHVSLVHHCVLAGNLLPRCSIASRHCPPPPKLTLLCCRRPYSHTRTPHSTTIDQALAHRLALISSPPSHLLRSILFRTCSTAIGPG